MAINEKEAPAGYVAVNGKCKDCDYNNKKCIKMKVHCMARYRKDKETVIFKKATV